MFSVIQGPYLNNDQFIVDFYNKICQKRTPYCRYLLDHLVGAAKQREREG